MTRDQYLKALKRLGYTPHGKATAELLHCSMRQLAKLASGEAAIPPLVADKLELMKLRSELETR